MRHPLPLAVSLIAALIGAAGPRAAAQGARTLFRDSIREVAASSEGGPYVVRSALSAEETAAPMTFSVSLRMRNFADLQSRLAAGETVSQADMEANYLPLLSDYNRVAAWLAGQGFTTVVPDRNHTAITIRGTVAQIARAFSVSFARVAVPGAAGAAPTEYTSAVTAPSLPSDLAGPVLGINRLQPHLRFHHAPVTPVSLLRPQDLEGNNLAYATPDDVAAAYNITSTWTGKGQVIAIVDEGSILNSDLNAFWTTIGSAQTASNVTVINVDNGPISSNDAETALDVEWAGALSPGATIRLYLAPDPVDDPLPQILSDLSSFPTMKVVSISYGGIENQSEVRQGALPLSQIQTVSQEIAQLTSAGVTVFAAAADGGSNPSPVTGNYSASSPLSVEYPASDLNVIGVGGTTMAFNGSWVDTGETAWNLISSEQLATGGGLSTVFPAPSWQTGTPVPAVRCVPDVAGVASATTTLVSTGGGAIGAFIVVTSHGTSTQEAVVGTSLATPVWAAIAAQINQARASFGVSSLGPMGPKIYPLAGTSAFTDITSGNNGAYSAGAGYDLCTGIGSPNVGKLISALNGAIAPAITAQPQSVTTSVGLPFSFSVTATGVPAPTYQWFLNGTAVSGATSSTYSKSASAISDAGSYTVVVSNAVGAATSNAAILTLNVAPAITTQPQSMTITVGSSFSFSVTATASPAPTYQWSFNGTAIAGATSATYSKSSSASTDAGSYTVVISNSLGTVTSAAATLTVNAAPAPASAPSGGGGGGAPSLWFYLALLLLVGIRRAVVHGAA